MKTVLAVVSAWMLAMTVTVAPVSPLAAPAADTRPTVRVRATATAHGITYTWTASTSAYAGLGYNLYIGTTAGGENATPVNSALIAAGCSGASCTYTYTNVAAQATYYAVVAACVPNGSANLCSAKTAEVAATIPLAQGDIAAPSGFSGSPF